MARLAKDYTAHISIPKKTSQTKKKSMVKMSSMNKSKKRSYKPYNGQGR
jgi:hypothetical protein